MVVRRCHDDLQRLKKTGILDKERKGLIFQPVITYLLDRFHDVSILNRSFLVHDGGKNIKMLNYEVLQRFYSMYQIFLQGNRIIVCCVVTIY